MPNDLTTSFVNRLRAREPAAWFELWENFGPILRAQLAVDGKKGKYPAFKGNVASVYSKPFCHGGASNGHYGGNAETYMNIGEAMGKAMVELMRD